MRYTFWAERCILKERIAERLGQDMKKTVITIARSYGSGGKTLGNLLAKDLGINCYSREILRMASDESGINEALFGEVDEKMKKSPLLFNILKKNPYKGGVLPPESSDFVSDDNLFNYQAKVIKDLAAQESCIIIGRCADYVLKDHDNCVHVFVCGDMDSKVQRMMHSYSLEESAAVERIKETDKQRKKYYSYYTGGDWEAASNYDLCLNTGTMTIEEAAEQILFYLKQKKYI